MNKEDQHIDKLFQSLKQDQFVAPQSFMDDLKLRMDAKAKLASRRKIILWFVFISMILIAIASGFIYTLNDHSVRESNRTISLSENRLNGITDSIELNNQNQKNVVRIDSVKLKNNPILSQNEINDKQEGIETNDLVQMDLKESQDLKKQSQNSKLIKNNSPISSESSTKKQSNNTKSKVIVSKTKDKKLEKNQADISEKSVKVNRKSESSKKGILDTKNNLKSSSTLQNSNQKNSDKTGKSLIEADNVHSPNIAINSVQTDSKNIDVILQKRLKKEINYPFNLSLIETNTQFTKSNNIDNKPRKNLEFNLEVYSGALLTTSKYKPATSANGFKSSPLFSPSFGIKTSLLYQNIYGSIGVEYFKTGDKQVFENKSFTQTGVDSTQTVTYSDTIWIDSMTFVIDSLIDYQITPIFDSITNSNKVKNQYTWISIPLSFGYRFQYNSWDFIPNVGVNLNFGIAQNSGQYPDASNQLVKYNALKFNMDIRIQTEVRKNFGKYYVFVSPYFKRNLKPIISYPGLRLTQNNWGLNGGFGMKF